MVHRRFVDSERLREGRLREILLAVSDEEGEHLPLLGGESLPVADSQEWEGNLLVRLVVDVRRRDALEDADEQGRATHEPRPARDVEAKVRAGGAFLPDIRTDLPGDMQQVEGVAHLDRVRATPSERQNSITFARASRLFAWSLW